MKWTESTSCSVHNTVDKHLSALVKVFCVSVVPFSQGVNHINMYIYENKQYLQI